MDPGPTAVKARRYDSSRRRRTAEENRARILDTAERLFLADGYAPTTIAAIADGAAVSAVLVYKSFGGKPGLVAEIQRRALRGAGPTPAPSRSDAIAAARPSAAELLQVWARLTIEVAPRVSPIMLLVREGAATDRELAGLHATMGEERLVRMNLNARRLRRCPGVRRDLTLGQTRDVLWTYSAPDLFDLLVRQRGWTLPAYADFVHAALVGQLLEPQPVVPSP